MNYCDIYAVKKKKKKKKKKKRESLIFFFFLLSDALFGVLQRGNANSEVGTSALCALITRVLRTQDNSAASLWAVRAIERDVDAARQATLLALLVDAAGVPAINDISVLKYRWVVRNRIAVDADGAATTACAALVQAFELPAIVGAVDSAMYGHIVCDVVQWKVLVCGAYAQSSQLLASVRSADAAVVARRARLQALCDSLLDVSSSSSELSLVAVERARVAGDHVALARLLAIDNVEQRLAVSYRKSLVEELESTQHKLAASVAADALVVLDAARGLVPSAAPSAGLVAQCEAALALCDRGEPIVHQRIESLLNRVRFGERALLASRCEPLVAPLGGDEQLAPVLRLVLCGDDESVAHTASTAIVCGASGEFLQQAALARWPDAAANWLSETARVSPPCAVLHWVLSSSSSSSVGDGSVVDMPSLVTPLHSGALERAVAYCVDTGRFDVLQRLCEAQQQLEGETVASQFGLGLAALFPPIATAVTTGASVELDDAAWRALGSLVDAMVRSSTTIGAGGVAFSTHRLVTAHVRQLATLERLFGLVRGALASCTAQTAYDTATLESVAEPLASALNSVAVKWSVALVVQARKRTIHPSPDAERRLWLLARTIAMAATRLSSQSSDGAARWLVAAGDACARSFAPDAAVHFYVSAVSLASNQCTTDEAIGDALTSEQSVLRGGALERLATVLAHARNFCAAASVCQLLPATSGARVAHALLVPQWRAIDWRREYVSTLFDATIGELLAKRCFVRGWDAAANDIVQRLSQPECNEHNDAVNRARTRASCARRLLQLLHDQYCSNAPVFVDEIDDEIGGKTSRAAVPAAKRREVQADAGDEQGDEMIQIEQ
jgi:hypothetical protein